ncbi:MAG: nucleotide exchange factor GrpE [Candidatus Pacebacteria bacterium]|jgi:molecular chaperone GrpE|nr:nucleotide exchange factor GrpE [bacterium]MDP6527758.1 nucleotide exchange factor GrpE [Candidatus Paceibacterota bacterium]MDP6659595.1 nucleotide exchange factor GrpE [Candidatus Paceibacterota bacterium]|tara:strand:- start:29593 stop:30159 length:567 start_codon:yes stop_codon:yes gene_type:complete
MPKKKADLENIDNVQDAGHNDVVFEPEDESSKDAIAKLRKKLKECQAEKQEYLDGWQRAKADVLNSKKAGSELIKSVREDTQDEVLMSLIPILDSFEVAMKGEAWESVDENWKVGVTHIQSKFINTLEEYGIEVYGEIGEEFDPNLHESMSVKEVEDNSSKGSIVEVLQRGYKRGNNIVRPAKVVVNK